MKLKTVDVNGVIYAEVREGKPVYVTDDAKEVAFDAAGTSSTIARITEESKGFKTRAQTAEAKLVTFEGIDDPAAAKKALNTVANLDAKRLVDAGQVETVKAEAIAAVEAKYAPVVAERDTLKGELYSEKIGGSFARSKFITEKIAIPPDMLQARFSQNFEIKDGKVVAKDSSGNPIYSRAKPGEIADFEEAIETLVDQYPQKDHILKGAVGTGGGARPANGGQGGPDLSKLSPVDRLNAARAAGAR